VLIATPNHRKYPRALLLGLFAFFCIAFLGTAQESNAPAAAPPPPAGAVAISNQDVLRSSLEVQDQMRNLQIADEKGRKESAAAAAELSHRLDLIESAVTSQKLGELNDLERSNLAVQDSNRTLLKESIAFACFGCVVLLFAAFLQWQMVSRFRSLAASLPTAHALEAGSTPAALGMGDSPLLASQGLERSTAQFLSAMERLEQRIREMEATAQHRSLHEGGGSNGDTLVLAADAGLPAGDQNGAHLSGTGDKFSLLLSKGQTLLKLDKAEEALTCFDEALAQQSEHPEALLGRGTALERLQRLTEAIECYDRAIASDGTMTMAYLHKGGVFNRMERYSEALECYEQALRSQDKVQVAEPATA
jgi:tetratricopeptide (TPR) repeat protein